MLRRPGNSAQAVRVGQAAVWIVMILAAVTDETFCADRKPNANVSLRPHSASRCYLVALTLPMTMVLVITVFTGAGETDLGVKLMKLNIYLLNGRSMRLRAFSTSEYF